MKMKHVLVLFSALSLSACVGTYTAAEYPLAENRISDFDVQGEVSVTGAYEEPMPFRMRGMDADLKQISEQMASQMSEEIQRRHTGAGGSDKEIVVRVTRMAVADRFAYFEGKINVELTLGNGETVSYERRNGSPVGPLPRILNGSIALAIIEGLENDTVRAYLAE
jgi:hypothetical protein